MKRGNYTPGTKADFAACLLVCELRSARGGLSPFVKAGFTLLEKRGLVQMRQGIYAPTGTFWDDVERWGFTQGGHATEETKRIAAHCRAGGS